MPTPPRHALLAFLALGACTPEGDPVDASTEESYPVEGELTLAFGGDVILGRRLNRILHDPMPQPWGSARENLREADITLVNGEGVISAGGMFYDKGDTVPYEYRAHPGAIDMLLDGGVDVVTLGNNHTMDYGPDALVEMHDLLEHAGIRAAAAGDTPAEAAEPVFIERDGLVVAFVGMVLTSSHQIWASTEHPGSFGGLLDDDDLRDRLALSLATAREKAHLVFFTPHWGPNGETEPNDTVRALALDVIDMGYDGILGHSAHVLQGMEVIDGKPVLYDGGNMLWDSPGGAAQGQAMHFLLELDEAGVQSVRGVPHLLGSNEIVAPSAAQVVEIIDLWSERSAPFGTVVSPGGVVRCDPGEAHVPTAPFEPPPLVEVVRDAPSRALPGELPPEADTEVVATWPELGVELVAVHLLAPDLTSRAAQWVTTWWRRIPDGPTPPPDLESGLAWTGGADRGADSHLPADWMLRASDWPEGELVRDEQILRIEKGEGVVDFDVYLRIGPTGAELPPTTVSVPLSGARIPIGSAVYTDDADRVLAHTPLP